MGIDYDSLVRPDKVHSKIFTDPEIFNDEMERIFHRAWVYVGHDSEIAKVGDYALKWIGRNSVIMTRSEDGQVRVLLNRCRHRGSTVCTFERGNSSFFRCPYHGWAYDNTGALVGVPFPDAYDETFDKSDLSLTPAARTETYQGFVFASLSPVGPSLVEHLGHARKFLDHFVNMSPVGRISLSAGCQKTTYRGNWKYIGMDGYHVNFTHRSLNLLIERKSETAKAYVGSGKEYSGKSQNTTVDLGNGHVRLDSTPQIEAFVEGAVEKYRTTDDGREYMDAMESAYGDGAKQALINGKDPHLGLFPNMQIITNHIRVIRPIAVDRTEVYLYPALLEGVPDSINDERLARHEWFYGPSGFGMPDDSEMFERSQIGLMSESDPWVYLGRGLQREQPQTDGTIVGHISDETTQRGQVRAWLNAMTNDAAAKGNE